MKPEYIHLIRHGESKANVSNDVYKKTPDWKVPLTKKGKDQAKVAGESLGHVLKERQEKPSIIIYTSPMVRALQTARVIKKHIGIPCKNFYEDPRLREQHWGNYQEDHLKLKIAKERDRFGTLFYGIPYGESGAAVYDRISTFLETLYRDFEKPDYPSNAIIVSHGLAIKAFLMRFFHWKVKEFEEMKNPKNCEIFTLKLVMNRYNLITPVRKRAKAT